MTPAVRAFVELLLGRINHLEAEVSDLRSEVAQLKAQSWGRVAPGDCSPGAPTDPDVQDYRIRFLR
jgi:hypothetical protein